MVLVVLTLLVVSVVGLTLLKLTAYANKVTVNEREDQTYFYFAEAGINLEKTKVTKVLRKLDTKIKEDFNKLPPYEKEEIINNIEDYYYDAIKDNFCTEYQNLFSEECKSQFELSKQFGKTPIVDTEIALSDSKKNISIISTGYFDGDNKKKRKVKQEIKINPKFRAIPSKDPLPSNGNTNDDDSNRDNQGLLTDFGVLSSGDITFNGSGGTINGDIGVVTKNKNQVNGMVNVRNINGEVFQVNNEPSYLNNYLPAFPESLFNNYIPSLSIDIDKLNYSINLTEDMCVLQ